MAYFLLLGLNLKKIKLHPSNGNHCAYNNHYISDTIELFICNPLIFLVFQSCITNSLLNKAFSPTSLPNEDKKMQRNNNKAPLDTVQ